MVEEKIELPKVDREGCTGKQDGHQPFSPYRKVELALESGPASSTSTLGSSFCIRSRHAQDREQAEQQTWIPTHEVCRSFEALFGARMC